MLNPGGLSHLLYFRAASNFSTICIGNRVNASAIKDVPSLRVVFEKLSQNQKAEKIANARVNLNCDAN